jgi:hypothetical protein
MAWIVGCSQARAAARSGLRAKRATRLRRARHAKRGGHSLVLQARSRHLFVWARSERRRDAGVEPAVATPPKRTRDAVTWFYLNGICSTPAETAAQRPASARRP